MRSKVVAAEMATAAGIATVICNGRSPEALAAVLAGERGPRAGTLFPARDARYSSFKLWLKYAKPSRGTLVVDEGAARALREGSASLLPVGVVEVIGEFDAGDAVEIAARSSDGGGRGGTLAKGISNYTAGELQQVAGLKSEAVQGDPAAGHRGGRAPRLPRARVAGGVPCSGDGHRRRNDHERRRTRVLGQRR